jgi:hypothetical protein
MRRSAVDASSRVMVDMLEAVPHIEMIPIDGSLAAGQLRIAERR